MNCICSTILRHRLQWTNRMSLKPLLTNWPISGLATSVVFFFNFSWLYFELHSLSFLSDDGMVERHLAEWRLRYLLPVLWNWFSKPFFIMSNKFKFKGIYISPINWLNFRLNQRLRKVSGSWSTRFTMSLSSIRCPLPGQSTFQSVHHPRV